MRRSLGALHLKLQSQHDVGHETNRRENGKAHAERTVKQSHERSRIIPSHSQPCLPFLDVDGSRAQHLTPDDILG